MKPKETFREHMMALLRDMVLVCTVLGVFATGVISITRPHWEPFSRLPDDVGKMHDQIARIQISVNDGIEPKLLNVDGPAQIVGPRKVKAGGEIVFLYFLRRNASCDSNITLEFYNVDTGLTISSGIIRSTKAPVTKQFLHFKVPVKVPDALKPGNYTYSPKVTPVECGIYGEISIAPSQIFEVTE